MTDEFTHPAVRRGKAWWSTQIAAIAVAVIALVFAAFKNPSTQLTIGACLAVVVGALLIFLVTKQIKVLRHKYRYADREDLAPHE